MTLTKTPTNIATSLQNTTLVVIDAGVQDYQLLLTGITPTTPVLILHPQQDGIEQITALISQQQIHSLQIIAHGSPGNLQLGNTQLNLDNLYHYQQQLQQWQITDLLIYSCELAQGETGQAFINQLHQLTRANIAASTNKVGNSQQGGSWELEVKIGEISSTLAIESIVKKHYPHVLTDPGLIWAKNLGASSSDLGLSIEVDSAGNIYTTGHFQGTADFDPGSGTTNLTSTGGSLDIFISKLNSDGSFAWAKNLGGSSTDIGYSIAVDSAGNIYTTGYFAGTADFDPGSGTTNLTSTGGGSTQDIFISKLNSDGSFAWAKNLGGSSTDEGFSIAVDSTGNIYTTGYFAGTADFDPGSGTTNLTSAVGTQDIFISKLNSDGSFAWAKNLGGSSTDIGYSIAVDSAGNIYTTGYFRGTADFDPGSGTTNLTSAVGTQDIFISKLNSDGSFAWAKNLGGSSTDIGYSIAVDSAGNIYTTGYFAGTADFDPGSGTTNLTSAGSNDIFISKLNSDGSFAWAKNFGASSTDIGYSIAVDSAGNIYTTGYFSGTADFDPGSGTTNLSSANSSFDIFISKLNSDGSFAWAKNLGGSSTDIGYSIAVDSAGNIYTTGYFRGTADFDPGSGTTNLSSAGSDDIFIVKLGAVATPGVTITQSGGNTNVTEGGATDTYTVVLTSQPTSNVTISVNPGTQTTTSANTLTFTAANWNTAQTVTVTAVNDSVVEGNHTSTITHTATSSDTNYNGITIDSVTANITDNDTAGVTITQSGGNTNVTEGGATDTYTVVLRSQPTSDVNISINPGTQTTANPITLAFTAANWNTAQTVTVTAVNDAVVEGVHTSTITHTATSSDANYNNITINSVTANITDNDTAGLTITQSGGSTNVTEGGANDTYSVVLTSQPTSDVTISINPGTQATASTNTLTFTSSNWNTAQTVTVTAVNDSVVEGNHTSTITHTATSSDTNYNGITIDSVTANITDNDTAGVTITQSGGNTNVTEGGATDTYTVVLRSQPTSDVNISINPGTQTTANPITLAFTAANWNTAQTVTVTAVNDAVVEGVHTSTITHTATSSDANYNNITINSVTANITDNDTAGLTITQSGGSTNVTEGGANDTYSVVLTSQPTSDVTISINPGTQATASTNTLTFTSSNWNTAQTVTVTAVNDSVVEGNHTSTITHTATSSDTNYNGITIDSVTANITDNDTAGVTITQSGGSTNVTEGGTTDTYTVVLTSQPTSNVNISINPGTQTTANTNTLTFTAANWNTAQIVTVAAVDDAVFEGNHTSTITHTATSSDSNYNGITIDSVTANITDNDTAGVTITQSGGSTNVIEGGATDTYTVVLTSQPTSNVNISINPGTQTTANPITLAFTAANWNTAQIVTVAAVDDAVFEGNHTSTITHTATSSDTNYNNITIDSVTANITDNDTAGVTITQSGGSTNVIEGGATDTYTVVLTSQPTSNVNISINPGTQTTANPITLAFTAANWNTAQIVTVAAVDDAVFEGNHTSTITHTATSNDANYNSIAIDNVTANITDNDPATPPNTGTPGKDILYGTAGDDTINGLEGNDYLIGNAGNDTLNCGTGNDYGFGGAGDDTINGEDGNDLLYGNEGNDTLIGGEGNDNLDGGIGDDTLIGGNGNDTYTVDSLKDKITETAEGGTRDKVNSSITWTLGDNLENLTLIGNAAINGTGNSLNNQILGNNANNILNGGDGDDWLIGQGGDDTLIGGAGNDRLNGGSGSNNLNGGAGNDIYEVDSATEVITEADNGGTDTIISSVELTLATNLENLTLVGSGNINGTGNDVSNRLVGNAGNNTLTGLIGNDYLSGEGGNDTLVGGLGNDTLVGGSGMDTFDLTGSRSAFDTILDFQVGETVLLLGSEFGLSQAGTLNASLFHLGTAADNSTQRFIYNQATGALSFDADGSGATAQVQIALFSNYVVLSNTNFTVV
ncbi:DUF4347 domain-containing protein [Nostoc sp. TCL26-01]|uniref:DUF4347 domain-containing protein n=1 Tax=Nostoc sp. TCL26-01 TaxID=2576904 RepID=UPI0015BFDF19|nr:DUF4347 domain-containing protein [Nostoc sp. TCL26-01]QLE56732.1 DUF4347 domain-containing protein [Nostoc sp. TCL26-01]